MAWEVRRSDHVARQGGDEFGVLLPSCTLGQAQTHCGGTVPGRQ
ncbi:hypothetical protein CZ787_12830 [Halomonas citrativorans]|uniref:GGDEF domain-containing protein n=1 Tax=Halomonas citrativorans TaxID=2742612 RepID=A0A1R4I294_9GAMM|nr:hypothetical protein CZ787_12830 [Halomonas citrativorans]